MSTKNTIAIAGAGFSGAVLARELAENTDFRVVIFDKRPHIAGNCHTSRDEKSQVMVHHYGPHIFHTNNEEVWAYVNRFTEFGPYVNRVKALTPRGLYTLPINLLTINQFFGKFLSPAEAREFVATLGDSSIKEPQNFEEQALKMLGRELYENFFRGYTVKQWGLAPTEIPASVFRRLPIRFTYDDNYYTHPHQGIPKDGYSAIVERIMDHPRIEVKLSTPLTAEARGEFAHIFYTGPIDGWFNLSHGQLLYRTVDFEKIEAEGDYQGTALINYTSEDVPFTRIHEHKHFAPWEEHERTVAFREFSREAGAEDTPYYPVRRDIDKEILKTYLDMADQQEDVSFLGRLATYRYLDMDQVIGEALEFSRQCLRAWNNKTPLPSLPGAK